MFSVLELPYAPVVQQEALKGTCDAYLCQRTLEQRSMAVASRARRRSDAGSAAVGTPSAGGLAASRLSARRCTASLDGSRRSASRHRLGAADS